MKETPLSTLERQFLLTSLQEGKRLDGRDLSERRGLDLTLGSDLGSCIATLGETRVLAQVSCELMEPMVSRPNEGTLRIEVDFSPMSGPVYAEGRTQDFQEGVVELQRLMERCLRESGCLDLESLCIVSESVVWGVRLDLVVLNHEGNLAEAASVAGLAALCHFRRPDVTLRGDKVTVHPVSERDPVPLAIHHHPICSTFAFFNLSTSSNETAASSSSSASRSVCVDPSYQEEQVMAGKLVFGVNPYREICTLHLAGNMLIDKTVVLQYAHQASQHAKSTVDLIKNRLAADADKRQLGSLDEIGFAFALKRMSILANEATAKEFDAAKFGRGQVIDEITLEEEDSRIRIVARDSGVVEMICEEEEEDVDDVAVVKAVTAEEKLKGKVVEEIDINDDSEEEDATTIVGESELGSAGRGWYGNKWK